MRIQSPLAAAAVFLAALVPLATTGAAFAAPDDDAADSTLVEEVEVRIIQVSLLAMDRKGRPILDLKPEDLEVRARGEELKIAFVERVLAEREGAADLPEVRLHVDVPGVQTTPTTITSKTGRPPRYFILFVDAEHDARLRRNDAAKEMARFVTEQMLEDDVAAVISYDGDLNLEASFTSNKNAVAAAVGSAYARPPRPNIDLKRRVTDLLERLNDCVVGTPRVTDVRATANSECVRRLGIEYSEELRPPASQFVGALEGIIKFAGGLNGHATVMAVSHGVAMDPSREYMEAARAVFGNTSQIAELELGLVHGEGARDEFAKMLELAIQEGVTFHFVDRSTAPAGLAGARQRGWYREIGVDPMRAAHANAQGDLKELAGATGGMFLEQKNLYEALDDLLNMERGRYTVGYVPTKLLDSRDLAKVKIDAKRKGVRIVRSRGFYQSSRKIGGLSGRIALGQGILAGEDSTLQRVPFRLELDPRSVGYDLEEGVMVASLTLHLAVQTIDGLHLADLYQFISHGYPEELWRQGGEEPVTLTGWLEAPPGDYKLVALVRNPEAGRQGLLGGAFRIKEVPAAARAPSAAGGR